MRTNFGIEKLIESGFIKNEEDHERAMVAERKLRLLAKESSHFKNLRVQLRSLIESYEKKHWTDYKKVSSSQLKESELAGQTAEAERIFIENRKSIIRKKLKTLDLTQEELGLILGHKSKTHMSELMNGITPFTLPDLVAIGRLLKIEIKQLVPVFLSDEKKRQIQSAITALDKPKLKNVKFSF